MNRHLIVSGFLVLLVSSAVRAQGFRPVSKGRTTVENFVQEMFFLTHSSGSLTLRGTCEVTQQGSIVVSDPLSNPPQGPFRNLGEAMTAISQLDPHLSRTRDKEGLMRVNDNRVTGSVLKIHLKRVHFNRAADPNEAIRIVLSTPEVREYLKKNHIEQGTVFIMPMNSKDVPKLSGDLRNVTVEQALDRIVKFFPGLWIYSECRSGSLRRVTIRGAEVGWPTGSSPGG